MVTVTVNAAQTATQTFASQQSFSQKLIEFTVTLAQNTQNAQPSSFAQAGSQITISGARARCRIRNAGVPAGSTAEIAIYGLRQSLINQLTSLNAVGNKVFKNSILVGAGASSGSSASAAAATATTLLTPSGLPIVYGGTIWFAYGDYNNQPDVALRIISQGALAPSVISAAPSSFTGPTSVVKLMQGFASQLGVPLENNGVTGALSNPYYPGTLMQQVYRAAFDAGINAQLVDGGTKLAIWPIGGSRVNAGSVPLISPATGMIGYPTFSPAGFMIVKMIYNPNVLFGGNIRVQSNIEQANKTWTVRHLDLALDSLFPGGEWMATAVCTPQEVGSAAAGIPPPVLP